ncbi:MAG: hypothetical protein QNL33_19080 [Akkermansiaceae bacterium]|jgi:hypothetical protein
MPRNGMPMLAIPEQSSAIGARGEDSSAMGVNQSQGNEVGELEPGGNSGAGCIFDADPFNFPPMILAINPTSTNLEILFEGLPGLEDWQLFGDEALPVSTNLTSAGCWKS